MNYQQVGERYSYKEGHGDGGTQLALLFKPDVEPWTQICPLKYSNHKDVAHAEPTRTTGDRIQPPWSHALTNYEVRGHEVVQVAVGEQGEAPQQQHVTHDAGETGTKPATMM